MLILLCLLLMSLTCPKCGGYSWLDYETIHTIQRCHCGLTKVVQTKIDGMVCTNNPITKGTFTIPAQGTQLAKVLWCLGILGKTESKTIAQRLSISMDKATTNLSVLKSRGLVHVVSGERRRYSGSMWRIEPAIQEFYSLPKEDI